ncbi:MAG: hypothetical protein GIX02_10685 [Candidatus Eremiobacteraeota bacterium]|nr:hypothetical protein [Candidatus Eremiobacteraeota bacterium]
MKIAQLLFCLAGFAATSQALGLDSGAASQFGNLRWRSIGPAVSGGRLAAVVGVDSDPSLYYIGAAGGGVFKTTNGGATWLPIFDKQPVASIGAIAVASRDKNTVWVGTGESNPRNDVSYGDGVWVSHDAGRTWEARGLQGTSQISAVLIDPRNPKVVLVGALGDPFKNTQQRGAYKTTDGGATWHRTLYLGTSSGISDMVRDPANPEIVYAGMWQFHRSAWYLSSGGPQGGLYRSVDGGTSWHKLRAPGLPGGLTGRIGLAVARSDPRRVYAFVQSKSGLLWRSDNRGATWRLVSSNTLINQRPFYYSHVFVDPSNANHLFATSVHLAESKDGGTTWKRIARGTHGDHHAMWISADGRRIIDGNDGGVALSRDNGATWTWQNNVPISQFYHVGYDEETPYNLCGGLQDNGIWCGPSDSLDAAGITGRYWTQVGGGDGTWVWPDPVDDRFIWEAYGGGDNGGDLWIFDKRTQQTTDISPYLRDQNAIAPSVLRYRFNWESPLAFSPQDGRIAYFGGNVLFKTMDRGRHWSIISPDLTRDDKSHQQLSGGPITIDGTNAETSDTILDIAPSPRDAKTLWVGTDDGLVRLTRDGGKTWRNVTMPNASAFSRVDGIEASRVNPGGAYAAIDSHFLGDRSPHVYATADYGAHWRPIDAGLPTNQFARSIREDPKDPNILYAGLEQSIWASLDGGAVWQPLQLNLPPASVRDIRIHPRTDDLIIATHGRGLWILDDLTPLQEMAAAKAAQSYLFAPRPAYAYHQFTPDNNHAWAGENPEYGAIITFYQVRPARRAPRVEILDAHGRVVRRINGRDGSDKGMPNATGINRLAWNLTEDAPAQWKSAPSWNRGLDNGPEVVPGDYTMRIDLDGRRLTAGVSVLPDPRATWTQQDYEQRHAFVSELSQEFSAIDTALNALDDVRRRLAAFGVSRSAQGSASVRALAQSLRRRSTSLSGSITSNMQNDQDNDFLPDMLRERLQALLSTIGDTFGAPTLAQLDQARQLREIFSQDMAAYDRFLTVDLAGFNRELESKRLPKLPMPAPAR